MSERNLSSNQFGFKYDRYDGGGSPIHRVTARAGSQIVGTMTWGPKGIHGIDTEPEYQRQGVATGMWNHAHEVAAERAKVPKPKHSSDRTNAGDAWARSVGGPIPRRSDWGSWRDVGETPDPWA